MILIADSGSTKTTWRLTGKDVETKTCVTKGINPFLLSKDEITQMLEMEFTLPKENILSVFYYGAGALPEKKPMLFDILSSFFDTDKIEINSDLLAAARALCQNMPGIACIMGTGSNSCFYDGKEIVKNVPPLGFILGDEGSGSALGRKLLSDILKNQISAFIRDDFFATYPITIGEILENTYRKPFPNRFLAQYTHFIAKHIHHPEIEALVDNSFCDFFRRNVMQYAESLYLPIHFTGSVAFYFQDHLKKSARSFGLTIGKVCREPMEELVAYHLNHAEDLSAFDRT